MAGPRSQAILSISRCAHDNFYEHTVTRFRLCNNYHATSRLLRANRHVQYHRAVLSTAPRINTCSICARILTTITPAHECDICLDAIFNFLHSVAPSEAKIIYDTHLTDTVSIRIDRTHTYL